MFRVNMIATYWYTDMAVFVNCRAAEDRMESQESRDRLETGDSLERSGGMDCLATEDWTDLMDLRESGEMMVR